MSRTSADLRVTGQALIAAVPLAAWLGALALEDDGGWLDGLGNWALLVVPGVLLVLMAAARAVPSWRRWQHDWGAQLQALRDHRDPGPGLREKTDALARQYARNGWAALGWPVLVLPQLLRMDGSDAARAATAIVLLAAAVLAFALSQHRLTRNARRWLADPPGPHREPAGPAVPAQVWAAGGRLALIVTAAVVGGVGIGLLVVLVR